MGYNASFKAQLSASFYDYLARSIEDDIESCALDSIACPSCSGQASKSLIESFCWTISLQTPNSPTANKGLYNGAMCKLAKPCADKKALASMPTYLDARTKAVKPKCAAAVTMATIDSHTTELRRG